jgi:hypothetical protein
MTANENWRGPRARTYGTGMRHRSPRTPPVPTSRTPLSARLLRRLGQAGAAVAVVVGVGVAVSDEPAPPSPQLVAAEEGTRAFLDERAAAHLRRLRAAR